MTEFRTSKEAFDKCEIKGQLIPMADVDVDLIKSLQDLSEGDQLAAKTLIKNLDNKSIVWNNVYTSYYDALHKLVDALLRFDKITSLNHLCLFAYLCQKHPELELDWNFFEKIRTKRNGINYYGQKVNKEDFTNIEVQIKLYINILKKIIDEKLK